MQPVPTRIRLSAPGGISIDWSDGHVSVYPNAMLRRKCPCAKCEGAAPGVVAEENGALPILGQEPIRAVGANPIGHYAIQFQWNDGHDAGLYTFEYLRQLCPCSECTGVRS
jgi:DUF971 family protein